MPQSIFRIGPAGELETVQETTVVEEDQLQAPLGVKRGRGAGSFIDTVSDEINSFYTDLVQKLKPGM